MINNPITHGTVIEINHVPGHKGIISIFLMNCHPTDCSDDKEMKLESNDKLL